MNCECGQRSKRAPNSHQPNKKSSAAFPEELDNVNMLLQMQRSWSGPLAEEAQNKDVKP